MSDFPIKENIKLVGSFLTSVVVVIGLIIWLAQLNWVALRSTEKNTQQDLMMTNFQERQLIVTNNLNKSTLLLSILIDEVKTLKISVNDHQKEAEKWKEKIRQNERNFNDFNENSNN